MSESRADPGLVVVLAYEGLCTFEFGIAVEVFGLDRPEFDFPWYRFAVAAADPGPMRAAGGVRIAADGGLDLLGEARTVIVPGWRYRFERPPRPLVDALQAARANGARFLSICSGAFVLAAAGLLAGKRATTHWRYVADLAAAHPDVRVEPDVLYVDEGDVVTSAGSAAGIDACLHLVRRDFGAKIANEVARRLVVPPHREGGQAQFVAAPVRTRPGRGLAGLIDALRAEIARPITVPEMAARAAMSERTFLRRFAEATGETPRAWIERERVYRAQALIEDGFSPARAAEEAGFASSETFRVAFRRCAGVTPAAYARRFRG
jgi:AraC family transcriptional activator FtrA